MKFLKCARHHSEPFGYIVIMQIINLEIIRIYMVNKAIRLGKIDKRQFIFRIT